MVNLRIGLGFDSHRIETGGPIRLGGIEIDCDAHFVGHSDADVLLHAVTDAILGAAGVEDIGQLFPDTHPANKNRDSAEMLRAASSRVRQMGYQVVNIDCVVQTEVPRIAPHKRQIQARLGNLLGIQPDCVGIKGKTGEGVGDVGKGILAEVIVVALLVKDGPKG
jgi:2-C-methyl-D-erythritol 2,4-cyclodiphosphate synthase